MNFTSTLEVTLKQREMLRDAEQRRWEATIRRSQRHPARTTWALGLRIPIGR